MGAVEPHHEQSNLLSTPIMDPVPESEVEEAEAAELNRRLGQSLSGLARSRGLFGWIARKMTPIGRWLEEEVDERKQAIGGIDNMWLLMTEATDSDFNPVCACTYTLRGKMTEAMLAQAMERIYKKFPKYRQRLTSVGRKWHGARFEVDPTFNITNHIHTTRLPEPAGKDELETLMGEFIAQNWNLTQPLWEMIIVENYHDEDGAESALIVRGHHTLADGQGFVMSQLYMTSYYEELLKIMSAPPKTIHGANHGHVLPSSVHPVLHHLDPFSDPSYVLLSPLIQLFLACAIWSKYAFAFLVYFCFSTYHLVWDVTQFLLTAWRVEMLTASQPHVRTSRREFASSKTVSMEDVRTCQRAFSGSKPGAAKDGRTKKHVTVNDVMCSVMSDVLGEEIRRKKPAGGLWERIKRILNNVFPLPIAFFIPISVRRAGDWSMRNLCTGWLVYLHPCSTSTDSVSTLYTHIHDCRSSLTALKHSLWPRIFYYMVQATGQAPVMWPVPFGLTGKHFVKEHLVIPFINFALQSYPVILTNVPGPAKKPVQLEGVEVIHWTALPPQAGKGTLGMGIISYAGGMSISIAADRVPESRGIARSICTRFEQRFKQYVSTAEKVLSDAKAN